MKKVLETVRDEERKHAIAHEIESLQKELDATN